MTAEQWVERRQRAIALREGSRLTGMYVTLKRAWVDPHEAPPSIRPEVLRLLGRSDEL